MNDARCWRVGRNAVARITGQLYARRAVKQFPMTAKRYRFGVETLKRRRSTLNYRVAHANERSLTALYDPRDASRDEMYVHDIATNDRLGNYRFGQALFIFPSATSAQCPKFSILTPSMIPLERNLAFSFFDHESID